MMRNVDNGNGYSCMEAGGLWEISVPSSKFYYKLKTILEKVSKRSPK